VDPFDCERGDFWAEGVFIAAGKKTPAEVGTICRHLEERHAKVVIDHVKRFSRILRFDREGVREVGEDGRLLDVTGAKVAWRPAANRASLEASLPLAAMPRLAQSPVKELGVWVRPASSPPPAFELGDILTSLPEPVSFEPYGKLRDRVFHALVPLVSASFVNGIQVTSAGASYQPGDTSRVETMPYGEIDGSPGQDTSIVVPRSDILFEPKERLGDLELGHVRAFLDWIGILRKGEVVDLIAADTGCAHDATFRGMVQRDGAIHAFAYSPGVGSGPCGPRLGAWSAIAIGPDGKHKSLLEEEGSGDFQCMSMQRMRGGNIPPGEPFASKTFDTFGWRGEVMCVDPEKGDAKIIGLELTYRWRAAEKKYVASWRRVPAPKKKAAAAR
jgi:hypothetical protein